MENKLNKLLNQNRWNITEDVINEATNYHNIKAFFGDLLKYGYLSWMVSSMIYYKDTHHFFEKHYDEIQELIVELEEQWIEVKLPTHSDLKNHLSWLSFEETARKVSDILELNEN